MEEVDGKQTLGSRSLTGGDWVQHHPLENKGHALGKEEDWVMEFHAVRELEASL